MPFGFSGGSATTKNQSTSDATSFGSSTSTSGGFSESGAVSGSTQEIAFEDVFAKLFGGASGAAAGLDTSLLTNQANSLFSSGTGFLDSLGGGVGTDFLESRVAGESPVLQEQIDALGSDLGRFFKNELNPAITSEAVGSGTLGGGRQGVAQGIATETVGREFSRGATSLRAADIEARDRAAGVLSSQRIGAAGTGLGALTSLGGIAELGFGAELSPFDMLSQILGGQNTLTTSGSEAFGSSEDFARAFSENFAESSSQSTGSSKSKTFGIKFGGVT